MIRRGAVSYVICIVVVALHSVADAANKTWTSAVSGDFTDAAKWTGGVPGAGDTATFNAAGTYTITFDNVPVALANPVLNQDLFFQAGTVTFTSGAGGPYTYRLTGAGGDDAVISGGSLTLGTSGNPMHLTVDDDLRIRGNASLIARFGSDITTADLFLGDSTAPAGNGTLTIDGVGSTLIVNTSAQLGRGGETGTLTVQNGATADFNGTLSLADTGVFTSGVFNLQSGADITAANIRIGATNATVTDNAVVGTFNVGNNVDTSTVTQDNNATLVIGAVDTSFGSNLGVLNVNSGGVFNTGGGTGTVTVNTNGEINISGGTLNLNGDTTVNGGVINRDLNSPLNLAAGKTFTAQNAAQLNFEGNFELSGGTTWNINSAAALSGSAAIDIGKAGGLTAVAIDGNGSSLTTGSSSTSKWGSDGDAASVTVRNNATANLGSIDLAHSTSAGTIGTIEIQSGADVTVKNLRIADLGGATTTGAISVTGAGSTLTQDAASTLTLGHSSVAVAEISVSSGATFTAGITQVNGAGRINLGGGTLTLNGDTTVNGGSITRTSGTLSLAVGRTLTAQNNAQINVGANTGLSNGTTWNINSGADLIGTGFLDIGTSAGATTAVTIDGSGSSLTTGASGSVWGRTGGTGVVTIRNGASANVGVIQVAGSNTAGTTGTLNVQSGATYTGTFLEIAPVGGTTTTGTVNVDGPGSSVNLSNSFTIGHADSGSATLNVTNGATFTLNAITTLNATGTINIDGGIVNLGTLIAAGIINFDSGSLNYAGNLTVRENGLLADGDLTLDQNQELTLTGTTTVQPSHALILDGGKLTTGTLAVQAGGSLIFHSGTLVLTQSGAVNTNILGNSPSATINVQAANISLGDAGSALGFHHLGVLNVGANAVTLNSLGYARLGVATTLQGGTINAPNGIYLPGGGTLIGNGTVNARVTGDSGALIVANGPLTLGNAASPAGFNFDGELRTQQHAVTLHSSAQAALGNLTTLGSGASPGTLNAANGVVVDFGDAVTGFGTINSDNALAKRAIINGAVQGNSIAQPLTLTGYVKGVGTFNNVVFAGTFDPGLSPTLMAVGSIAFSPTNMLVMELDGVARGSQYDAILASGTLGLDGALQVALIDGFSPAGGNSFDLFDWASVSGTFDTLQLPALAGGLTWDTSQLYTTGVLAVIAAGLAGDYNEDGVVDAADYVVWRKTDGSQAGYDLWRANFGRTAGLGTNVSASAAVPEPAGILMMAIALLVAVCRRRSAARPV